MRLTYVEALKQEKKMSNNLKETISNLQKDFTANPKNAVVQYESNSILKEGLQSVVTLKEHKLVVD